MERLEHGRKGNVYPGIPERLFTEIVPSGTVIGKLSDEICEELDIEPVDVIAVASHDTQSAFTFGTY